MRVSSFEQLSLKVLYVYFSLELLSGDFICLKKQYLKNSFFQKASYTFENQIELFLLSLTTEFQNFANWQNFDHSIGFFNQTAERLHILYVDLQSSKMFKINYKYLYYLSSQKRIIEFYLVFFIFLFFVMIQRYQMIRCVVFNEIAK